MLCVLQVACQRPPVKPLTPGSSSEESSATAPAPLAEIVVNPFQDVELFNPPYTNADQARRRLARENPNQAQLIAKIADTPQAKWLGEWSGPVQTVVQNYVDAAHKKGKVALMVAYHVPHRDCGQYSAGGAADKRDYLQWIRSLADGIGAHRKAIVVLEPDALPQLEECLTPDDQRRRLEMLSEAVETLESLPGVAVYLDAGHSRWVDASTMAQRLERAGLRRARGFSLNVSNYVADEELTAYGEQIVKLTGLDTHFIIDSSRNGNGPAPDDQWCNPEGRALGRRPQVAPSAGVLDAYVWIKNPGESDGTCQGGPEAGEWFQERALELARNASW